MLLLASRHAARARILSRPPGLQLALDGADRLVAELERRQRPLATAEAARLLLASRRVPAALARRIVADVVDADARLSWRSGDELALVAWQPPPRAIEDAVFCVVDVETTGMQAATDRIVEIGAVRVVAYDLEETYARLIDPGRPLPAAIEALTGIRGADLRRAPGARAALAGFLRFAGDSVIVAHNARFDVGFLDAELRRAGGRRLACPVLDTVAMARRLVPGRSSYSLAALAERFSTNATPCHRALPDALATAEILRILIGRAQERGAATVADLIAMSAPPERRAAAKRPLVEHAPDRPGTYVMRDRRDRPLYVGTAGNLKARTVSYFRSTSAQRAVERVLPAVERIEFREAGSAFEARLDEIAAITALRPAANRRGARPDRTAYLRLEPGAPARLTVTNEPVLDGAVYAGPLPRGGAERSAGALRLCYGLRSCRPATPSEEGCLEGRLGRCLAPCRGPSEQARHAEAAGRLGSALREGGPVPVAALRHRRRLLASQQRFEEAAAVRDAEAVLAETGARLRDLRSARACHGAILAAHRDPRLVTAFAVAWGLVVERRPVPRTGEAALEVSALAASVARGIRAGPGHEGPAAAPAERSEEVLLIGGAFARPRPGLAAIPFGDDETVFRRRLAADRAAIPRPP
jgi:DNA polymerase-3 subunit epsilon